MTIRLVRHVAAIDGEGTSRDVARAVRQQPAYQLADIFRGTNLAAGHPSQELRPTPRERLRGHLGIDPSRADAIDADLRCVLNRRGLGQANDSVLACGVPRGRPEAS